MSPSPPRCLSAGLLVDALRILDAISIGLSGFLAYRLCGSSLERGDHAAQSIALSFTAVALASLLLPSPISQNLRRAVSLRGLLRISGSLAKVAALMIVISIIFWPGDLTLPAWSACWLALSGVLLGATRGLMQPIIRHGTAAGWLARRTAVFGAGPQGQNLIKRIMPENDAGVALVGIFDDRKERVPREIAGAFVLGGLEHLTNFVRLSMVDEIVIALPWYAEKRINQICDAFKSFPIDVRLSADPSLSSRSDTFSSIGGVPLLHLLNLPLTGWQAIAKRIVDCCIALFVLLICGPMMLFVALAIRLETPGPALFRQPREGFGSTDILVYKFRTMYVERSDILGAQQCAENDPRVTPLGRLLRRTRIDELPQFLNVLGGTMSVVGPRPHPLGMRTRGVANVQIVSVYAQRRRIKPGITGWAQINALIGPIRDTSDLQARVDHDLFYIDHWSMVFDFRIMAVTAWQMVQIILNTVPRAARKVARGGEAERRKVDLW